jgi:hypothetical protein
MQERDEDLAWAYDELDAKDLIIADKDTTIAKKDGTILKLIIAIIAMGAAILGSIVFAVVKLYVKKKIPIKIG